MKIVICVFACIIHPFYCHQVLKIQETWGRQCEDIYNIPVYYFVGEDRMDGIDTILRYPHRIIYLQGVKNDYLSASYKQNLGIKYILDYEPNVEFVYVCGTDTYLVIDRLIPFLKFFDPTYKLCIGGHYNIFDNRMIQFDQHLRDVLGITSLFIGDSLEFFYGGAGFILTKGLLSLLYIHLEKMTDQWLLNVPSQFSGACDVCLAYYVTCLGGKLVRYYSRFYECNYKGFIDISHKIGYDCLYECCNNSIRICDIISCHNMSLNDFDNLYRLLGSSNTSGSKSTITTLSR
jgi:hypothetical protein